VACRTRLHAKAKAMLADRERYAATTARGSRGVARPVVPSLPLLRLGQLAAARQLDRRRRGHLRMQSAPVVVAHPCAPAAHCRAVAFGSGWAIDTSSIAIAMRQRLEDGGAALLSRRSCGSRVCNRRYKIE
jgi:hypothetical protein